MIGFDFLGMGSKHWPVARSIEETPKNVALGLFDAPLFGNPLNALMSHLDTGKYPAVRVQIFWSYQHRLVPLKLLKERARHWHDVSSKYPRAKFYLSFSTEHNERSMGKLGKRIDIIEKFAPRCTPVNNPWKGSFFPGEINETHAPAQHLGGRHFASMDGLLPEHVTIPDWLRTYKNAEIKFLWHPLFNLIDDIENKPPPPNRTAVPYPGLISEMAKRARVK